MRNDKHNKNPRNLTVSGILLEFVATFDALNNRCHVMYIFEPEKLKLYHKITICLIDADVCLRSCLQQHR